MTRSADRTGILIVHVWRESRSRTGLRARITQTSDTRQPGMATSTAASPDDVCSVVRTWVEDFAALAP